MATAEEIAYAALTVAYERRICKVLKDHVPRLQKVIAAHKLHRAAILSRAACMHCCNANAALLACDRRLSEKALKSLRARVNMLEVISGVIQSYLTNVEAGVGCE